MQTLIFLLILFFGTIAGVLLYFKIKTNKKEKLSKGICPKCGAEPKEIIDQTTNTKFKIDVINARVLKNHGCSGVVEIEYNCKKCGLKEVHSHSSGGCGI